MDPSPDFLRGALLAALTSPAQAEVTDALLSALSPQQGSDVLTRLIRAAALFGTVAPLVGKVVHHQPDLVGAAIESLVLTGPTARCVERHLLMAITPDMSSAEEISRLIDLLDPTQFHHLQAALRERAVQHARKALENDDTEDARAALALSLNSLGISLTEVGRHREALAAKEEAVGLRRDLTVQEPVRYTPDLTQSLTNMAIVLCELGRHEEELELRAEAAVRWRILSQFDPDEHEDAYQRERDRLASSYSKHGHEPDAAWRAEQAAAHRLGLETPPPDRPT